MDDLDPAADFLAREQEQLGELEEEIGSLSGTGQKKKKRKKKMCIKGVAIIKTIRALIVKQG